MTMRLLLEKAIAAGYGLSYDAVVHRFAPFDRLLDEIASFVHRSAPSRDAKDVRVLDVASGIGNVCLHLASAGYDVYGCDVVGQLVDVSKKKAARRGLSEHLHFENRDIAAKPFAAAFDAVVIMNTLYWHPNPQALLAGCHASLRPGGHGIILTYGRAANVRRTASEVRAADGSIEALRSLRWLVPTAVFERLRDTTPRYLNEEAFHEMLKRAGFEILETRRTFLAGICHLAWVRRA